MAGLRKAWKTKSRFHKLPTSPLEISPEAGEIPTFPQLRRRGGWKSGKPRAGFPLSHRPFFSLSKRRKKRRTPETGGLRPPPAAALRARRRGQAYLSLIRRNNCRRP